MYWDGSSGIGCNNRISAIGGVFDLYVLIGQNADENVVGKDDGSRRLTMNGGDFHDACAGSYVRSVQGKPYCHVVHSLLIVQQLCADLYVVNPRRCKYDLGVVCTVYADVVTVIGIVEL